MGVCRFEDLRVWQAAREQCNRVGELLKRPAFRADRELSDQMNAAPMSVIFNISEGFLRRRNKETAQFLRYAFASNGEVKTAYYVAEGRNYTSRSETATLIALNESIARMLRRWESQLDLGGPRTQDQGRTRDQGRTKHQAPSTKDHE
jgi:four helix bundle protein